MGPPLLAIFMDHMLAVACTVPFRLRRKKGTTDDIEQGEGQGHIGRQQATQGGHQVQERRHIVAPYVLVSVEVGGGSRYDRAEEYAPRMTSLT